MECRSAGDDYSTSDDEDDARRSHVFKDLELLGLSDVRATSLARVISRRVI